MNDLEASLVLADAMAHGASGAIERQEKAGQLEQAAKQTLPRQLRRCTRADLEALGFVFGIPEDELFVAVQFPKGWQKVPTSHSMWSDLLDASGKKRASIFYKAAFYDRDAFLSWEA